MSTATPVDTGAWQPTPVRQPIIQPPGTGSAQSSARRHCGAPGSVHVRIQRLALEGFDLGSRQERDVRMAVEAELGTLLATDPLPGRLRSGGAAPRLPGRELQIGSWQDAGDLGRQIARALYEGLQR